MDTEALAAAFPLASPDLPAPLPGDPARAGGVLYGINPDSNGIVWWDRWSQDNHNSRRPRPLRRRQVATSSSSTSLRNLYHGVQVAVIDPEDEYHRLADAVGGTIIAARPARRAAQPARPARRRPPRRRADPARRCSCTRWSRSCSAQQPPPAERAALDRAIIATYAAGRDHHRPGHLAPARAAAARPRRPPSTPTATAAGRQLAARLAPWATGSFKDLFDGPTTTSPDGHLVVWSLRQLPDELRTVGTLLALDAIWRDVDTPADGAGTSRAGGWSSSTRPGC